MLVHFAALSPKLIRESNMDRRTTYLVLFALSLTSGIASLPATTSAADEPIGVTAVVRNTVSQLEPKVTKIAKGDEVVRNEVVRTAADSDARFVFRDDTNLSLGPGSTLKLDRTVFDDPKAGDIAIKLTSGTFRFVSGHSEKEAYVISTPIATVGVRGTNFDVQVQRQQNTIVLASGELNVCDPNGKNCHLLQENQYMYIFPDGTMETHSGSPPGFVGPDLGQSTFAESGGNDIHTAGLGTGTGGTGGPTGSQGSSGSGGSGGTAGTSGGTGSSSGGSGSGTGSAGSGSGSGSGGGGVVTNSGGLTGGNTSTSSNNSPTQSHSAAQ